MRMNIYISMCPRAYIWWAPLSLGSLSRLAWERILSPFGTHLDASKYRRMVWWKSLIVDMILGKNHPNQVITTIDSEALKFNDFFNLHF